MAERADHVEAAEGRLSCAVDLANQSAGHGYIAIALTEAQVHATLAIAEELRGLNERLDAGDKLRTIRSWCDDPPGADDGESGGWLLASHIANFIDQPQQEDTRDAA